jgi:hypothetical protein
MGIETQTRIIQQRGTRTAVEAFTGTLEEGALAYATDTGKIGIYTNGAWVWIGGGITGEILVDDSGNILIDDRGNVLWSD